LTDQRKMDHRSTPWIKKESKEAGWKHEAALLYSPKLAGDLRYMEETRIETKTAIQPRNIKMDSSNSKDQIKGCQDDIWQIHKWSLSPGSVMAYSHERLSPGALPYVIAPVSGGMSATLTFENDKRYTKDQQKNWRWYQQTKVYKRPTEQLVRRSMVPKATEHQTSQTQESRTGKTTVFNLPWFLPCFPSGGVRVKEGEYPNQWQLTINEQR
jgi:hypothetical protein